MWYERSFMSKAYAELLSLSRRASVASPAEKEGLSLAFDRTLHTGFGIQSTYGNPDNETWVGMNAMNAGGLGSTMSERSAITISTYFACIRIIAEDCAKLPLKFFAEERVKNRPYKEWLNDDLTYILSVAPNERITAFDFWSTMIQWAVGWGMGFAEKEFNHSGDLIGLYPIHPSRIQIFINKDLTFTFKVINNDGTHVDISESNMFYFFGMSVDGYIGYSVIQLMQNTLGRANLTDRYARHFFSNNGRPTGALVTEQQLNPQARNNLKQSWQEQYAGPMNAGKTAVLENGIKYQPFGAPFKDLEFVAQWKHNQLQICEWFRVNPRKVGVESNAKGWATIDGEETDHHQSCLLPWLLRVEQNIRRQLMPRWKYADNVKCEFDSQYILRGDVKTRTEKNQSELANGVITPNEWREREGMNPVDRPEMDVTYVNSAFIPLSRAGEMLDQPAQSKGKDNGN